MLSESPLTRRLRQIYATSTLVTLAFAAGCSGHDSGSDSRTTPQVASLPEPLTGLSLQVVGNQLVDSSAHAVRLLGVNRSGTEFMCIQNGTPGSIGRGIFDGPSDLASVNAIQSWHANTVRVPLNEDCWLGINGVNPSYGGATYQAAIKSYVNTIHQAGLYVILDLHWSAPGTYAATTQQVLPDADHSVDFWKSVATAFASDQAVVFDLYNEPSVYGTDLQVSTGDIWACWLNGCGINAFWIATANGNVAQTYAWSSAGMQTLVNAVRGVGANNPIMVGGLEWSNDLTGWLAHKPTDPKNAIVASWHAYEVQSCHTAACWNSVVVPVAAQVPVVTGETGDHVTLPTTYVDTLLPWLNAHGIGYLGWTWNAWADKNNYLINDYAGTPSANFGQKFHDLLMASNPAGTSDAGASDAASDAKASDAGASDAKASDTGTSDTGGGGGSDLSTYNFEQGVQGWTSLGSTTATVSSTTAQAFAGTHSLAILYTGVANGTVQAGVVPGALVGGSTIAFHIWIPASAQISSLQPYMQEGAAAGWRWTAQWVPISALTLNAWNTINVVVPSDVTPVQSLGVQLAVTGSNTTTVYVDAVSAVTGAGPPSDPSTYNFEQDVQGWTSLGSTTATLSSSNAQAFAGTHSLAMLYTGVANGTVQAGVVPGTLVAGSNVAFHLWIPASAQISSLQAYMQEGAVANWRWTAQWVPISALTLDHWNTINVVVPSDVTPVQSLGVQLAVTGSNTTTVYVDAVNDVTSGGTDAGTSDAGATSDATTTDTGTSDARSETGTSDAGTPPPAGPMPLISQGLPAYANYGQSSASSAVDADYTTVFRSGHDPAAADPNWLALDLSTVPVAQRTTVYSVWFNEFSYNYFIGTDTSYGGLPGDYAIQGNSASGGGQPPSTGWVSVAPSTTGNLLTSGANLLNLGGYNWVRFNCTKTASNAATWNTDTGLQWNLYDAHLGNDGWKFGGDSITANAMHHKMNDSFDQLVHLQNTANPAFEMAGHGGWKAGPNPSSAGVDGSEYLFYIDAYLANFPGKYFALSLGTNDAATTDSTGPAAYAQNMSRLIGKVIAAGKIPVVPTIPYTGNAQYASIPNYNAQITSLYAKYGSSLVHGPDLYTIIYNGRATMFDNAGDLHPNEAGNSAIRHAWADAMVKNVFGG
jgi:endoglucanase